MNIVIKIGGHILYEDNEINTGLLREYAELIKQLYDGGNWVVVIGGGKIARKYIEAAKKLGADDVTCDSIAIKITRLNAALMTLALGKIAEQRIPESVDELRFLLNKGKIIVTGGMQPGQSTIAVSALAASIVNAERIVIATDVDGIYTEDPKKSKDAKLIPKITYTELEEMALRKIKQRAGEYQIIDTVSLSILKRTNTPLYYINGKNTKLLEDAIKGKKAGTIVTK